MGLAIPLRMAMTPAMKVVLTAPRPTRSTPSLPRAGAMSTAVGTNENYIAVSSRQSAVGSRRSRPRLDPLDKYQTLSLGERPHDRETVGGQRRIDVTRHCGGGTCHQPGEAGHRAAADDDDAPARAEHPHQLADGRDPISGRNRRNQPRGVIDDREVDGVLF